jgi:hypothetical protein
MSFSQSAWNPPRCKTSSKDVETREDKEKAPEKFKA